MNLYFIPPNNPEINNLIVNSLETYAAFGDFESLLMLGSFYKTGKRVEKNLPKALGYYERAWNIIITQPSANHFYGGHIMASCSNWAWTNDLLELYLGNAPSIFNPGKAEQFIQEHLDFVTREDSFLTDQIYIDFHNGIKYDKGLGVEQDHVQAQKKYEQIFTKGHSLIQSFKNTLKEINSCYQEP